MKFIGTICVRTVWLQAAGVCVAGAAAWAPAPVAHAQGCDAGPDDSNCRQEQRGREALKPPPPGGPNLERANRRREPPARGAGEELRQRPIKIDAFTTAVIHAESSGITVSRRNPDGSQLVMTRTYLGARPALTRAYLVRPLPSGGRVRFDLTGWTRDEAKNGDISYASPRGLRITLAKTGLRQASLVSGAKVFEEHFASAAAGSPGPQRVERTEFGLVAGADAFFYPEPIRRSYQVVADGGQPLLVYDPVAFQKVYLKGLLRGFFEQPLHMRAHCDLCPAPVVRWEKPVREYPKPIPLLGDLQITTAVKDGLDAVVPLDRATRAALPDLAELERQVNALQQQIDARSADDPALSSALSRLRHGTEHPAAGFVVSEDVRSQIHQQVRENIQLHDQGKALRWSDLVASGEAGRYIFQVSDMLDEAEGGGEACRLTTGDLLQLEAGAALQGAEVRMRVVAGKARSCAVGTVVDVGVQDAQAMLNDFVRRQEANMMALQADLTE